jgi:hypothetical protein
MGNTIQGLLAGYTRFGDHNGKQYGRNKGESHLQKGIGAASKEGARRRICPLAFASFRIAGYGQGSLPMSREPVE